MGRLITYDNIVHDNLNVLIKNKEIQTGLIIGQCTSQKDIVIRLCPTPSKDEDCNEGTECGDNISKPKTSISTVVLDESWICQHAKQLVRALPGGLDILGLYVIAPSDYATKNQVLLRQVLFSIFKLKNVKFKLSLKERILLNVCPVTSKIICRTYDVSDYKCSPSPSDWKMQSGPMKCHRLRCQINVDIRFPLKKVEVYNSSLQSQIELSLRSFLSNVENAIVFFNGIRRDNDELLDVSIEGKRSKKKPTNDKSENSAVEWYDAEVYIPLGNDSICKPEVFSASSMMTFKGIMHCRGYVYGKATVQEGINTLKQDIIRSIVSRCEIHCEDLLLIEEEQKDPSVVHELPRRVFAPLPQADIHVCDYQFHHDTAKDSLDAFRELLNLELCEQDIDTTWEISPTTSTLILPESTDDKLSEFGDGPARGSPMMFAPVIGVITTIAVGVVAYVINSQMS